VAIALRQAIIEQPPAVVEQPRFWIVMQVLIVIFVLIGMVIAIVKLS